MTKRSERGELLWRILVCIISGIILNIWKVLIFVLAIANWFVVLFSGKRDKGIADFCDYWNSEVYRFIRYLTFVTNERPFPFAPMKKMGKFK
ncbi:MAG: DUF4389 domain-containing protein [archaeon]